MKIISLGRIDKKLLLVVAIIAINTLRLVVSSEVDTEYGDDILSSFFEELGPLILGVIFHFILKNKKQNVKQNKKSFKYIIYLFFLRAGKLSYEEIYNYFLEDKIYDYDAILITVNGVEIILMTIGASLLLKYKYYAHQKFSMTIYCILSIISDFILRRYFQINYSYIYILLIFILAEIMVYIYLKYMMDILYYHYAEIILYWGITGIILKAIIYSSLILYEHLIDDKTIIDDLSNYFNNVHWAIIVFYQGVYYILLYAVYILLIVLMIFYLQPNHMIITDEVFIYSTVLYVSDDPNRFYILIPFAFQIFFLLFYFEILEFNFWKFNKNTKKNIETREEIEVERNLRNSILSNIEIDNQYLLANQESEIPDEVNIELDDENNRKNSITNK